MASTLLLDPGSWDLTLDLDGNMAVANPPYALAQDAASAVRVFQGEVWYNSARGVPYWQQILGYLPPLSLVKAKLTGAALTVPGVLRAQTFITGFTGRRLSGQVQVTDSAGRVAAANF